MKRKSLPTGRDSLFVEGYGNENPGAFQSPRPLRGATVCIRTTLEVRTLFQPTRPLRGATSHRFLPASRRIISTHAPLAGRDKQCRSRPQKARKFQPTRPLRGATGRLAHIPPVISYFNPRAPCGARPAVSIISPCKTLFQPTRPLRGATMQSETAYHFGKFQPTRPLRGATLPSNSLSISQSYFNPRAPCGARPTYSYNIPLKVAFQPTRPLRGATADRDRLDLVHRISTHAPLAGRDAKSSALGSSSFHFNPRAPCGARPLTGIVSISSIVFQPTRPLRGATQKVPRLDRLRSISTHAPLAGRDR